MLKAAGGFTLVELVVAMIIMGILAAVVVPRFSGQTGFEARGFRDETLVALRYAQKSAIAARRRVCVDFPDTTQVSFRIAAAAGAGDCNTGAALSGPGGKVLTVQAPGGVSFAPQPKPFSFDSLGRPSFAATQVLNIDQVPGISIEAETGYVH